MMIRMYSNSIRCFFFFFKQKTAYEIMPSLVGSEMCIRDSDMTVRHQKTVKTLLEAMPYIRRFWGTTVVLKYGGAAMTSPRLQEQFTEDIVLLRLVGMKPVVVHGGGPEISRHMARLGMEAEFVDGHRVTDAATMEVAKMVLVGKVNKEIVGLISRHGGTAVGISGEDGHLLKVTPKKHQDKAD